MGQVSARVYKLLGAAAPCSNMKQKPGFPSPAKSPRGNATLGKSSVIGLVSGSHTYFLAAGSHEEVRSRRRGAARGAKAKAAFETQRARNGRDW